MKYRTRLIKAVVFSSLNDIGSIEESVNKAIFELIEKGGKIVSIIPCNWGISPMNLIYNIIYETEVTVSGN